MFPNYTVIFKFLKFVLSTVVWKTVFKIYKFEKRQGIFCLNDYSLREQQEKYKDGCEVALKKQTVLEGISPGSL